MHKTQAKIDNMSTAEWQQYHQLLGNRRVVEYFSAEIERFSRTPLKPDDVLRRFSLNGDGQLDVKEFQLALKRLGILQLPPTSDTAAQQQETADALMKARELYSVFCPSQAKKLDIDMFCRIMTEWSLQLIRAHHAQQQQTDQRPPHSRPTSSRSNGGGRPSGHVPYRPFEQYSAGAALAAPYATEHSRNASAASRLGSSHTGSSGGSDSVPASLHANASGRSCESDAIWRRISDAIAHNMDKLSQIFFKMDITCSGSVSRDEFELGLSHIGVFLTPREYERVYDSLTPDLKIVASSGGAHGKTLSIRYADFLALFHGKSPLVLPSTSKQTSPPVAGVGNARLWDFLVQSIDKLQPLFQQLERINQRYVSPDTFRDCLARCGLALSNADYAALRVRLLPFTDSASGAIGLAPLMQALKASDHSSMKTSSTASPIAMPSARAMDVSPIRTGRRTNFQAAHESYSPLTHPHAPASAVPHPAGKSNEQRNVEANRTIVKIRDESRWKSDCTLYGNPEALATSDTAASGGPSRDAVPDDPMFASRPLAPLEKRILLKLAQMKELGQLGSASPQSIFPGDRFGRITRGQFRQSLVHLSVLARYAEVEALFWTLDPTGRGYMVNHDLYDHLNSFATRPDPASTVSPSSPDGAVMTGATGSPISTSWGTLPAITTDSASLSPTHGRSAGASSEARRLPRSAQKVLEGMLLNLSHLLAICERSDADHTGMISPQELLTAIQELGILASTSDLQSAIFTIFSGMDELSRPSDGSPPTIPYKRLEARLGQLCSDLLSPKKRKMHLSTTSVLLAPHEQSYDEQLGDKHAFDMHTVSETDALWNCPRRKMNHDHRATKSSFRIADHVSDNVGLVQTRLTQSVPKSAQQQQSPSSSALSESDDDARERQLRKHRAAVIAILHDLLERRIELKTAMDLHRNTDANGQVRKDDVAEILMTSRLSLNFASTSSSISARDFVDTLFPSHAPDDGITYLDLLHRVSDVLAELKWVTAAATAEPHRSSNFKHQQQRQTARRLDSNVAIGLAASPLPRVSAPYNSSSSNNNNAKMVSFSSDEASVRRKLLSESRLKELLLSDSGRQSAAILIRHAFKGLAPREMVVPIENGEYEATCRASDLKHVCYRLGLDLDVSEQQFVVHCVDRTGAGFVTSPQLLDFFMHLALAAEPPQVTKHSQLQGSDSVRYPKQPAGDARDASDTPRSRTRQQYSPYSPHATPAHESWSPVQAG